MCLEDTVTRTHRRRKCIFFLLLITLIAGLGSFAFAEAPLTTIAIMTPTDYLEPAEGTLMITLINSSGSAVKDVYLSNTKGQAGTPVGNIAPGESCNYAYPVKITEKILNAGQVDVYITCKVNDKTVKMQTQAAVRRVDALPQAKISIRIGNAVVREGGEQMIVYTITNTGNVAIKNAQVNDVLNNYTSDMFSLEPGEIYQTSQSFAVSSANTSEARLTYVSSVSGSAYDVTHPKVSFLISNDDVSLVPDVQALSVAYGDSAAFQLEIRNNGRFHYRSLSLSCPELGEIGRMPGSLRAGESVVIPITTPPMTQSARYAFTLHIRDDSGTPFTMTSAEIAIDVSPLPEKEPSILLEAGGKEDASFTIRIQGGSENIYNAVVKEDLLSYSRTLSVIPANRETVLYVYENADSKTPYRFTLSWRDGDEDFSCQSEAVNPPERVVSAASDGQVNNILDAIVHANRLPAVVIGMCAATVLFVTAFYIALSAKRKRAAAKKRKQIDELGKTSKFEPIRSRDQEKENQ